MDWRAPRRVGGSERLTFLVALAVVGVITAVDAALGSRALLVELLIAGPLIAAVGASPRQTAITAVLAFAVSIPLGWASDAFGSADHLIGMTAVAAGGAVSVLIARLRSARERDAARLRVQYDAARVLAEADSLQEAAPRLLRAIGAPLGWELGHLWAVEPDGGLRRVGSWQADGASRPAPDQRLAAKVWQSDRSSWLEAGPREQVRDLAFPVKSGEGCVAVLEFRARELTSENGELLALTEALGAQLGEFIMA